MKLNELIAELNSDADVSSIAANALTHLLNFVEYEAYCPCCGGISHCVDYCAYSVTNPVEYQKIKRARKLATMEFSEEFDNLVH